jgi:hypothetical protein
MGDIAEGSKWFGEAEFLKTQLVSIYKINNACMETWKAVTPEVNIFVKMVNGFPQAFIFTLGGIYLESGFIDVGSWSVLLPDTYKPAHLYFNDLIKQYLDSTATPLELKTSSSGGTAELDKPFKGTPVVDGMESRSIGCAEIDKSGTVYFSDEISLTGVGLCPIGLQKKKYTVLKIAPSLFTGKLKLYIQAMYGSTRDDYMDMELMLAINGILYGTTFINPMGLSSTWLYTSARREYFLCNYYGTALILTPLKLTGPALGFATILANHPRKDDFDFATRIEAYILAYATPDPFNTIHIEITAATVRGVPISYGWHSNWRGDEAHMVTIYADTPTNRYYSNQYKLKIIEELGSDGVLLLSIGLTEVETDIPFNVFNGLNLIYYDETVGSMTPVMPATPFLPEDFSYDAPVYCYTRLNPIVNESELIVVRIFKEQATRTAYTDLGPAMIYGPGTYLLNEHIEYVGANGNSGFYTTGALTETFDGPNTQITIHIKTILNLGGESGYDMVSTYGGFYEGESIGSTWYTGQGWELYGGSISAGTLMRKPSGSPGEYTWGRMFTNTVSGTQEFTYTTNSSESTVAFLEIPIYACDAIITGTCVNDNKDTVISTTSTGYWPYRDAIFAVDPPDSSSGVITLTKIIEASSVNVRPYTQATQGFSPGYIVSEPAITHPDPAFNTVIKEAVGSKPVDRDEVTTVVANSLIGEQRYFYPILSNPDLGTIDVARTSVSHGARSAHYLYAKDYGYIKTTSVGWA